MHADIGTPKYAVVMATSPLLCVDRSIAAEAVSINKSYIKFKTRGQPVRM